MLHLRKVTLVLCILAIVITVGGCKKSNSQSGPAISFNATGMPIVDEPLELTVLTMRWGDMGDTFTRNQWLIDLENVQISRLNGKWFLQTIGENRKQYSWPAVNFPTLF
ncbi:MAG: hypothetical protein LBH43_14505 [Treponema sp.]|nr:hypothetical protein [Treponema sp.]